MLEPLAEYMRTVGSERDAPFDRISNLKQQNIIFIQSQQIDREVSRNLSRQLKEAQDKQLALEKEVPLLRHLIQEGAGGFLQLKDFKIEATGTPGEFRYGFTVRQLVQGFRESTGKIEIRVIGERGETTDLYHKMKFNHFQNFQGSIKVPDDFEPERLVIEVKPKTDKITPVSETLP